MADKMKFLVVHCTDTPSTRNVSPDDIFIWHLAPLQNADGTFTFMKNMKMSKVELAKQTIKLPSGKIIEAASVRGRGWSKPGYSDLIDRLGKLINLVPYDNDEVIDSNEITNGASGYNSNSRHIVLAGGWPGNKPVEGIYKPEELYVPEQLATLMNYFSHQKQIMSTVKIIGHNEISKKTCPNFDVEIFLKTLNL